MSEPPAYMDRDTCLLPPLISGQLILPAGSRFACPHYLWFVQWNQFNGWRQQPMWRASTMAPPTQADIDAGLQPPSVSVQAVTAVASAVVRTTAVLLLGASQDVTVQLPRPMSTASYTADVVALAAASVVLKSQTPTSATVTVTAGLAQVSLNTPVALVIASS